MVVFLDSQCPLSVSRMSIEVGKVDLCITFDDGRYGTILWDHVQDSLRGHVCEDQVTISIASCKARVTILVDLASTWLSAEYSDGSTSFVVPSLEA